MQDEKEKIVPVDDLPNDIESNVVPVDDLPDDLKKKDDSEQGLSDGQKNVSVTASPSQSTKNLWNNAKTTQEDTFGTDETQTVTDVKEKVAPHGFWDKQSIKSGDKLGQKARAYTGTKATVEVGDYKKPTE
jgi:hypothetical protein